MTGDNGNASGPSGIQCNESDLLFPDFGLHLARKVMNTHFGILTAGILLCSASLAFAQGGAPNDAQIAAIVVAANTVDIDAGKLAESKSHNKEVKEFAHRMVVDHTGVNKSASDLVHKLGVKPEPNATSKSLTENG